MELTFECPGCGAVNRTNQAESASEFVCRHCGHVRTAHSGSLTPEGLVHCPFCGTEKLYIQKDFPQGLGLTIVIAGFAWATWFWYWVRPVAAYAVLIGSALLDLVLWKKVPDVTICYRCLGQLRGSEVKPVGRFMPFDLEIGETFRQERMRIAELRKRQIESGGRP
jgi:predicted RNA-binding Zn-ribbon protein involved in translation (DUF1610 family)